MAPGVVGCAAGTSIAFAPVAATGGVTVVRAMRSLKVGAVAVGAGCGVGVVTRAIAVVGAGVVCAGAGVACAMPEVVVERPAVTFGIGRNAVEGLTTEIGKLAVGAVPWGAVAAFGNTGGVFAASMTGGYRFRRTGVTGATAVLSADFAVATGVGEAFAPAGVATVFAGVAMVFAASVVIAGFAAVVLVVVVVAVGFTVGDAVVAA